MAGEWGEWAEPFTVTEDSSLQGPRIICADCCESFRAGDSAQIRYGPRGGAAFHEDCARQVRLDEEAGV